MALQPKSTTVSISVVVAALTVVGSSFAIVKSCNDELEARMLAKQQVGELRQNILKEHVDCNERIEMLNEAWRNRVTKR